MGFFDVSDQVGEHVQVIDLSASFLIVSSSYVSCLVGLRFGLTDFSCPFGFSEVECQFGLNGVSCPFGLSEVEFLFGLSDVERPVGLSEVECPFGLSGFFMPVWA